MSSALLSIAGWYFLPNLVTGYAQTALYSIFIRAGDPKPAPGSPRFVRDRRVVQIAVIVLYLLYTIYEADYQLLKESDFYTTLGVPCDVGEKALQSKFRRLTVQYHPDKASAAEKPAMEALYIQLTLARDTLIEPAKRFAYDRFGPEILGWQNNKLVRDFVNTGIQNLAIYYAASAGVLILLGILGYLRQGMFWRYWVMASLFVFELYTATRTEFPWLLTEVVNPFLLTTGIRRPYLPFQLIVLLRKLTLTFFIAMSQLGPLLQDPKQAAAQDGPGVTAQQLDRVDALTKQTGEEVNRLVSLELMPYVQTDQMPPAISRELRTTVKEWLVQNTIRNDPEVSGAIKRVLDRRRQEGRNPQAQPQESAPAG
ncbi:membrane associated chaperone like [Lecanosticta acicola]|uniref:Membrane associated chaperone like n=1 Tax=Lecanosticta acicola TaxID=111012 RepID=A0AAI8W0M1_9PEZI|nr:membrane associated chaperone like [Lecanosticta acicola]